MTPVLYILLHFISSPVRYDLLNGITIGEGAMEKFIKKQCIYLAWHTCVVYGLLKYR